MLRIARCRIKTLEVVALTSDIPEKNLRRGQVGTVLEILTPDTVEVEFSDLKEYLMQCALCRKQN
jgi:hypothetical protein